MKTGGLVLVVSLKLAGLTVQFFLELFFLLLQDLSLVFRRADKSTVILTIIPSEVSLAVK